MQLRRARRRPRRQHPAGAARAGRRRASRPPCWPSSSTSTPAAASRTASRCAWSRPRRRRASCGPAARSSSRRRATPASGWRSIAQRKGYKCVFICPDKVSEDKRNVLRAYGAEVVVCPTAVEPGPPRLLLQHVRPAGGRDRRRLEAQPVRQPGQPASRTTCGTGPGAVGADRRADHALRGGHRHRRHDQRHRPLPQGGVRRAGPGDRGRPGGLGVLRRHRSALPRRGRRRGLLAHHLRQGHLRPDRRRLRRRLVRDDPAAGARGGAAGRRLVRDGDGRGAAGRGRARPRPATPWSSCSCPTAAAATSARCSTTPGWRATASCRPRPAPRWATCCAARTAPIPALVHAHPNETVADAAALPARVRTSPRCRSCGPNRR